MTVFRMFIARPGRPVGGFSSFDQRLVRVEQHARRLPQRPGRGDGDAGPDLNDAAIAIGAAPAGLGNEPERCQMPESGPRPKSAAALEERLRDTLSPEEARLISVHVIDVSRPGTRLADGAAGRP